MKIDEACLFHELARLRILENAIINYGGGVFVLLYRLENIFIDSDDTILLINDLISYFTDLLHAGGIHCPQWQLNKIINNNAV